MSKHHIMTIEFLLELSDDERFKVHQAIDKVTNQWTEINYEEVEEYEKE